MERISNPVVANERGMSRFMGIGDHPVWSLNREVYGGNLRI
jgi:hypothetical protein